MDIESRRIILFDGVCQLCHGMVRFILKRDRNDLFLFAPLQSSTGEKILKARKGSKTDRDNVIFLDQDRYFEKSTAVLQILKYLGGIWWFLSVLIIIPRPVRDFFYDLVASNRYRISGKYDVCPLPEPKWRDRFLD